MRKGVFAVAALCALALLALPLQAFAQQEDPAGGQTTTEQTTTPAQTTTPEQTTTPDETTTVELPSDDLEGDDDNVPQQYTDPLAGENGNSGEQQGQQQAAPVATAPVVQSTASELPRTGDPLDAVWIAGALMLLSGLWLRRVCRTRAYPYSLPRY